MTNASLSRLSNEERCRLEELLIDFDHSWTLCQLTHRRDQLSTESPGYRAVALVELVKIDLEYRHRHNPQRIEWYLEQFPELGESKDMVCELLQVEWSLRAAKGDIPDAEELRERFPEFLDRLDKLRSPLEQNSTATMSRQTEETIQDGAVDEAAGRNATDHEPKAHAAPERTVHGNEKPGSNGPELPCEFGRYRLLRVLGRGSMGTVYLAEDKELQRQVALKRPRAGQGDEDALLARFYQEAHVSASLSHPGICPVFDLGRLDEMPFITMALVEGDTLAATIRRRTWDPKSVAILVRQVALALEEAHRLGIVHRDLKASNIMLNHRDEPIVMDFGLAYRSETATSRGTAAGTLIGTPAYASPEQLASDGREVGPASDIYSLGVVLFELLTGSLPFRGSLGVLVAKILRDPAPAPSQLRGGLPRRLDDICVRMLAKSPADRPTSMTAVAEELREFIEQGEVDVESSVALREDRSSGVPSQWGSGRGGWRGGALGSTRGWISLGVIGTVVLASRFALREPGPEPAVKRAVQGSVPATPRDAGNQSTARDRASPPPENPQPQQVWTCPTLRADFRWCPPGSFRMGSSSAPPPNANEAPVEVTLTQGFWVAQCEVTQGQWKEIMGTEPWKSFEDHREGPNFAASHVTWQEAITFCREVTERARDRGSIHDGWELRLPTEAEWEYFARAGTTTRYSFGEDASPLSEYAWWRDNADRIGDKYAHEVGRLKPNPWHLFDIHGNVYEWCQDSYNASLPGGTDPLLVEPNHPQRVNRGGGWDFRDELAHTSSNRRWIAFDERRNNLGLRVVMGRSHPISVVSPTPVGSNDSS